MNFGQILFWKCHQGYLSYDKLNIFLSSYCSFKKNLKKKKKNLKRASTGYVKKEMLMNFFFFYFGLFLSYLNHYFSQYDLNLRAPMPNIRLKFLLGASLILMYGSIIPNKKYTDEICCGKSMEYSIYWIQFSIWFQNKLFKNKNCNIILCLDSQRLNYRI